MAAPPRTPPHLLSWLELLAHAPSAFDFHQAMRRIENAFRDLPLSGQSLRPSQEPVRLGQEPSLAFPPAALASFQAPTEGQPGRLYVRFLGLFGSHGALPLHLTEYARERVRHGGDRTFTAFVDLFHHRMLLLFHRAWAVAQPTASHDRPTSSRFAVYIGSLFGVGLDALRVPDVLPEHAKLQYAGWLSSATRPAEGLEAMVTDYFGIQARVEQFVGEWLEIPDSSRFRLGYSREVSTLGETTVLGSRVWRSDHKFRLRLGPLSKPEFSRFLPGNDGLTRLLALVRAYVGDELAWDVRLVLAAEAAQALGLARGDRLGWSAPLGKSKGAPRTDVIVDPVSHQTRRTLS